MAGKKGPRSPRALAAAAARKERNRRLYVLFARNLIAARVKLDISQSEVARRASLYMPKIKGQGRRSVGRDLMSNWESARNLPDAMHLEALAKVFKMKPEQLLPSKLLPSKVPEILHLDNPPRLHIQTAENDMVWLRVNQRVPLQVAMKIVALLEPPDGPGTGERHPGGEQQQVAS